MSILATAKSRQARAQERADALRPLVYEGHPQYQLWTLAQERADVLAATVEAIHDKLDGYEEPLTPDQWRDVAAELMSWALGSCHSTPSRAWAEVCSLLWVAR